MTQACAPGARCPRATQNGGRSHTRVAGALGGGSALGLLLRAAALLLSDAAGAATPRDYNVFVAASVSENPPAIVLSWPAEAKATGYQISRKLRTENTWSAEIALARTATSWTDTHVVVGTKYEYRVRRTSTIASAASAALTSYGYLCAGIRVSPTDHRGTVVLVVDETMALPLESELSRLEDDLVGDGWTVRRHDVARSAAVTSVKAVRLEVTPGGTFVNTSQAVTANGVVGEPPRPSLAIRLDNGMLRLTWPAFAVGYALQEASEWTEPGAWTSVAGEPGREGDLQVWTVPPSGSTRYFRLSRP